MSRIIVFLLALFSPLSHAFTTLDPYMVDAEVRKVNNFVSVDGDTVKVNVMGKGYGANQPYFNKTVSIPKSNFLSWLKANLKNLMKINPWWIAFSAAMAAAGWAFDELLNQYTKPVNTLKRGYCIPTFSLTSTTQCVDEYKTARGPISDFKTSGSWYRNTSEYPNQDVYSLSASWKNSNGTSGSGRVSIMIAPNSFESEAQPVSDTAMLDSIFARFMSDPVAAAQAMTAPGDYPYDDLFKGTDLKYIPGISEADYPALDCYLRGALQTSNPAAGCYATETEYQRIKQMAEQLQAGVTPGGVADSLNDTLKDPLTQAQLEESMNKLKDIDTSGVTKDATLIYDEGFKQLNDSIAANVLPSMPELVGLPQVPTGSCQSLNLSFTFFGKTVNKQFPGSFCPLLDEMKDFLGWLLAFGVFCTLIFTALRESN